MPCHSKKQLAIRAHYTYFIHMLYYHQFMYKVCEEHKLVIDHNKFLIKSIMHTMANSQSN